MLIKLPGAELLLQRNIYSKRYSYEVCRQFRDIHIYLGRWMVVAQLR